MKFRRKDDKINVIQYTGENYEALVKFFYEFCGERYTESKERMEHIKKHPSLNQLRRLPDFERWDWVVNEKTRTISLAERATVQQRIYYIDKHNFLVNDDYEEGARRFHIYTENDFFDRYVAVEDMNVVCRGGINKHNGESE